MVGINCSLGPEQLIPLVERLASVTNLPISAQPNAGMPMLVGRETVFPLSPEEMGSYVRPYLMQGQPMWVLVVAVHLYILKPSLKRPVIIHLKNDLKLHRLRPLPVVPVLLKWGIRKSRLLSVNVLIRPVVKYWPKKLKRAALHGKT